MSNFTTLSETYTNNYQQKKDRASLLKEETNFSEPTFRMVLGDSPVGIIIDAAITLTELKEKYRNEFDRTVLQVKDDMQNYNHYDGDEYLPLKELIINALKKKVSDDLGDVEVEFFVDVADYDKWVKEYRVNFGIIVDDYLESRNEEF